MAPHRLTVRLDDDNAEWVDERAGKTGRSKAYVVNDAISKVRGDDRTTPHRDGADRTDRLEELEARIRGIESILSDRFDSKPADARAERVEFDEGHSTQPAGERDGPEHPDAEQVRERVREHFAGRERMDADTVDTVATAAAFLAEHDRAVRTGELKEHTYAEFGDDYSSEVSMWNSIDRYFEEAPGVEKAGYGEWKFSHK